jgi:hypothetical protein
MKGGSNYATYKVVRNFLGSEFEKVSFTNLESVKKNRATTILNTIEFCISVGNIFVETFMNKDKRITRENIDDLQKQMDESMSFFHDWWKQIEGTAGDTNEIKNKKFISQITFANLRTGISGFFQYARYVFEHTNTPYVPFLHSNSSILEALFSQMRSMNRDTPERYMSGLAAVNTTHSLLALERNKIYSKDQILEDGLTENDPIEGLTRRKD